MPRRPYHSSRLTHRTTICFTPQQRADLQRLADRIQGPVSQVARLAIQEKIERDLPPDREVRRAK